MLRMRMFIAGSEFLCSRKTVTPFSSACATNSATRVDEGIPGALVVALEVVVVALGAGPDDEVRVDLGGEIDAALQRVDALAAQRRIGVGERAELIRRIGVQPRRDAVDVHRAERATDGVERVFVDLAGVVVFEAVHQSGQPVHHAPRPRDHIFADYLGMVARRHEARAVGAKRPDADAILHATARCCAARHDAHSLFPR